MFERQFHLINVTIKVNLSEQDYKNPNRLTLVHSFMYAGGSMLLCHTEVNHARESQRDCARFAELTKVL